MDKEKYKVIRKRFEKFETIINLDGPDGYASIN